MGSCGEAGWLCFPKGERSKGEKGRSEMAGGPWLSGSRRAETKDPGGWQLRFQKIKGGLRLLFALRGRTAAGLWGERMVSWGRSVVS